MNSAISQKEHGRRGNPVTNSRHYCLETTFSNFSSTICQCFLSAQCISASYPSSGLKTLTALTPNHLVSRLGRILPRQLCFPTKLEEFRSPKGMNVPPECLPSVQLDKVGYVQVITNQDHTSLLCLHSIPSGDLHSVHLITLSFYGRSHLQDKCN